MKEKPPKRKRQNGFVKAVHALKHLPNEDLDKNAKTFGGMCLMAGVWLMTKRQAEQVNL